ncbi:MULTISPECIES: hypothetical protein [Thiomicrorhabdus]|uniref:Uncharacterized protein n=1 Tax=Thiomicrorhabdus heinhorstiae TaxID=2748010 RepID=A0ABS0BVQ8_9GAMM|nr:MULTISPECIES: hypothetical protein [Thiomicrorhabdus]MBF6057865.1 hypothetical protein [Thiomicrorhabdus heinhorstiae]
MDIWSKITWYGGALLGAIFLIVALQALSTAEDGLITVEGLSAQADNFRSLYEVLKWFVFAWLAVAIFVFLRFLGRMFGIGRT